VICEGNGELFVVKAGAIHIATGLQRFSGRKGKLNM
jgi:hypothetical protein